LGEGFTLPVVFEHLYDAKHDSIGARFISKEIIHRASVKVDISVGPFKNIACSNGLL